MTTSRLGRPDAGELDAAWDAVTAALEATPVVATDLPSPLGAVPAWLKLETTQPTGSFKVRGAIAALQTLPQGARAVSASAGNHALGMAWAATRLGVPVTVVTAENASALKLAALDELVRAARSPVSLVRHGLSYDEAESCARGIVATEPDAEYISAYSDRGVIAGQATIGRELDGTAPDDEPLTVVASLGGGGLTSGLSLWAATREHTRVVAVETESSMAASAAVAAGRRVDVTVGDTIADGLAGNLEEGGPTPEILGAAVAAGTAEILAVSEDQIKAAMRWLFTNHGLVAEGAGAAPLAAVLAGRFHPTAGRVVVVITGRNVSADTYAQVLSEGIRAW